MKWLYKYDKKYNYIPGEEIQVDDNAELPDFYCEIKPPDGMYLAKFDPGKGTWFESATKEYIESLQPPGPDPGPSETEVLRKQVADLYYLIALGGS
ncbi:hypothetical protein J5TS1_27830 [Bacillus licheniformis]|uniref:hypothetical protein n=1 Tax=Bacillus TaxID=1386 RepID=UPI000CDC425C|nr:hypothetical protein [Bacillus licheniformis]AUZ30284.1 hypothetical protein C1T27_07990 [Bacillus licheniformis]MBU8800529.1 hypothetical protein [Bacillus licheniformis]MEC1851396.1 hypothetical protein [Bacillus licheniformis]MED1064748.1 hypothetical protein [Bacillus licheniformis]QAS15860.1 hypothetical protein EQJ69_08070 [Bacillus licheniformis]